MTPPPPTPDGVDNYDSHHRGRRTAAEDKMMTDDPTRRMDESGQGPKRAVAVAVPCPLGIQPKIRSTENSSSKKPAARVVRL
jgi:hypothetical protein